MFFKRLLSAFNTYIIILVISSSILISGIPEFPLISFITYLFIHILLIYIGIYHFKIILYFVYFIVGYIFDIFLLIEIGSHILTFMILILLLSQIKKFIILFSPLKIYILIIIILFTSIICEMFFSFLFFNFSFQISNLLKSIFVSLLISYPSLYFFNKIDKLG